MERLIKQGQQEERQFQPLTQELNLLGIKLLDSAVIHTPNWKRSTFEIPKNETQEFYSEIKSSPIGFMLEELGGFRQKGGSNNPYDLDKIILNSESPTSVRLLVDKDSADNFNYSTSFSIIFTYDNNGDNYSLNVSLINDVQEEGKNADTAIKSADNWSLLSSSFQPSIYETGYEGSDFKIVKGVSAEVLDIFHSVFKEKTIGTQVEETPLSEIISGFKLN